MLTESSNPINAKKANPTPAITEAGIERDSVN
jgi:hypothetical protein